MKGKIWGVIFCIFIILTGHSQGKTSTDILRYLTEIENSSANDSDKFYDVERLRKEFLNLNIPYDSVYARILHRLGYLRYYGFNDVFKAIDYTKESLIINSGNTNIVSPAFRAKSYFNLGLYYKSIRLNEMALSAWDSCRLYAKLYNVDSYLVYTSALLTAQYLFSVGNYQESIDLINSVIPLAITNQDSLGILRLRVERAFSEISMGKSGEALKELLNAEREFRVNNHPLDLEYEGDLYKAKAFAFEKLDSNSHALKNYRLALKSRKGAGNAEALVTEYSDVAVFFTKNLNRYKDAENYYTMALDLSLKHNLIQPLVNVYINFSDLNITTNSFREAVVYCNRGLQSLIPNLRVKDIFDNPIRYQVLECANLFSMFALLANKSEALLYLFDQKNQRQYISVSLQTCKLTDVAIDELRRRQNSLNGRLFWQKKTRNFYRIAIEASYLANDPASMLYFMEKSRAALLNDKLNELGSLAYLPVAETEQEQQLRINIASLEKQKETLSETDTAYNRLSQALLNAKEEFNRFIKTLETKFPVYYQYKYNTSVPSIQDIREKLLTIGQTYLSFFETDSVVYALCISKSNIQFKKIPFRGYADTVKAFIQLCKDRQLLNASYNRYANLANILYKKLFEPFNIPKGKVIVSPDLNFIPLDALVKDKAGKAFLVYDYAFDYTYSAGYLVKTMKKTTTQTGAGFLGIAPESFASNLSLAKLHGSVSSLESIFSKYNYGQLLKYRAATRHFFLKNAVAFNLLHLYAHAKADTDGEPVLYMNDSAVVISELSQWNNPKVGLAFLAACETGAGELYIGEGINSIARSFAAIGVPSTIATLWKADNKTMYAISEKFYYYLSQGLFKDEALQKAKIDFVKQGSVENLLPYYWASAVLSGNPNPLQLTQYNTLAKYRFILVIIIFSIIPAYYLRRYVLRKTKKTYQV